MSAKKTIKIAALVGSVISILIFSALFYLFATTSGLRFVIARVNSALSDYVKITADIEKGSVLTGFKTTKPFEVLVYDVVDVRAKKLNIEYDGLGYLAISRLDINLIDADTLEVELLDSDDTSTDDETDDGENFRLNIPVKIFINKLKLKDFAYLSSVVDVLVKKADLSLQTYKDYAAVDKGEIDNPTVHLKYESEDDTPNNLPEILSFDNGNGAIEKIYDIFLPLDAALHNLKLKNAHYYMNGYDTGNFNAFVDVFWSQSLLKVKTIDVEHQLGKASLKGSMDFIDYYNLNFKLTGEGAKSEYNLKNYDGSLYGLKGSFSLTGDLVNMNVDMSIDSPYEAKVKGRLNPLSNELPCYLSIESDKLFYPLQNTQSLKSKTKELSLSELSDVFSAVEKSLSPNLEKEDLLKDRIKAQNMKLLLTGAVFKEMHLTFDSEISGHGFTDLKTDIDATVTLDKAHFNNFSLEGLLGKRNFSSKIEGDLTFTDGPSYQGNIKIKADDASGLHEKLKGEFSLNSDLSIGYDLDRDAVIFDVASLKSDFYFNSHKANLNVENFLGSVEDGFSVDVFKLSQNDNYVVLKGDVSEDSYLEGWVSISDLSKLDPKAKGAVTGKLLIEGALDEPNVIVSGKSEKINYGELLVKKLVFDSNVKVAAGTVNLSVISNTIRLAKDIKAYKKCSLDVEGTLEKHSLTLSCGSDSGSYLAANGGYNKKSKVYSGSVSNLIVVSNVIDPISIADPVELTYNNATHKGSVSTIKLTDGNANLDISEIKIAPNSVSAIVDLNKLQLKLLKKYLPKDSFVSGLLSLHSEISVNGKVPLINAKVKAQDGVVVYKSSIFPYDTVNFDLNANSSLLTTDLTANLKKDNGLLSVHADVADPYNKKNLSGKVKLKDLSLDLFTASTNSLNFLKGKANIEGSLDGTLAKPLFFGKVSVKGSANPSYNVGTVDDFDITVNANGSTGILDGDLSLNGSKASLNGNLNWENEALGQLNVDADNLPIFLLSYGEAQANVHTKVTLDKILKVTGNVEIPKGLIKFKSIENSAIAPSKDEIFVDDESNLKSVITKLNENGINNDMSIDVDVNLGNDVKVDAMGLKADVLGSVKIHKATDSNTVRGSGLVYLEHGRAELYGHKFIVNNAEAKFKGNLFTPLINSEVVVDPSSIEDDVVAGVRVKGRSDDLNITLFSMPAMSQNEILSYLLYGHGLEKSTVTGNSDNSSAQLLMTLGLGTTTGILNSVVGIFGMDGVQLGSSGTGDDTQVEVQTYLSNRIRLSYGYGVFNSVNEFKLRYEIMRRLYAEFISSLDQSIDLIYSFEVD